MSRNKSQIWEGSGEEAEGWAEPSPAWQLGFETCLDEPAGAARWVGGPSW